MKNSPVGGGAYAFVDLFGFALEGDFDFAVGEYEFDFGNEYITLDPVQFAWGRFSYATTLKKEYYGYFYSFFSKSSNKCRRRF